MNKKFIIYASLLVGLILIVLAFNFNSGTSETSEVFVKAKEGEFIIDIETSGELEAKNSVDISGPSGLMTAQIWNVKIDDIIPEGTVVKKGDYVARLDQTQLLEKINNAQTQFQQSESKYTQVRLDTAMELRKARDELINLEYAVKEKKIVVAQSKFEPPATQQQAQIEYEKAQRAYKQADNGYDLKIKKAVAQMREAYARMADDQNRLNFLLKIQSQFNITAPENGMLIYDRTWSGKKRVAGSTIDAWDPVVATLPDLNTMISRTYVNEVDIRVVSEGQKVNISLDAFPDKKLTGKVIKVANVGEQKPNSDAKVFQVDIELDQSDSTLRPSMTTGNNIIAKVIPKAVYVPLECIHSQGDTLTYVLMREGMSYVRKEVLLGQSNTDNVVVTAGLKSGDELYLSDPKDFESRSITYLEAKVPE